MLKLKLNCVGKRGHWLTTQEKGWLIELTARVDEGRQILEARAPSLVLIWIHFNLNKDE